MCQIDFEFILKFEDLYEEQKHMIEILDLENIIQPLMVHQNKRVLSLEEKKKYYEMLDTEELQKLEQYYELDFKLFGYDNISDFLN